jgi:hypothetical protein
MTVLIPFSFIVFLSIENGYEILLLKTFQRKIIFKFKQKTF